jgi:predicted  nucleic acid-binding Zn-ribbon protein
MTSAEDESRKQKNATREYAEKVKAQIDEWASQIEKLQERGEKATEKVKKDYGAQIKDLEMKIRKLEDTADRTIEKARVEYTKHIKDLEDKREELERRQKSSRGQVVQPGKRRNQGSKHR